MRGMHQKCSHNANEISAFDAELVLRDVPGKSAQRRRQTQRLGRLRQRTASLHPPPQKVIRIPCTPRGLGLFAARCLTLRLATDALPYSDARVRPEPPATDRARSLPDVKHR